MALSSAGLYTHIRNNTIKSVTLIAIYPLLVMAVVWCIALAGDMLLTPLYNARGEALPIGRQLSDASGGANSIIWHYWPIIVTLIAIWFAIAYIYHTRMIRRIVRAHPVTRKDMPELYNMLENLCIAEGMSMPNLEIIETHSRNAFASGIKPANYTITVTRGLLRNLQSDEVEAVLAHELTHIKNGDVRLLMIAVVFTGLLGLAAQLVWSHLRLAIYMPARGRRDGRVMLFVLAIGIILGLGYLTSLAMRFAISRKREYMADAGAVEMTKNPEAMMRALIRISGREELKHATAGITQMCIDNSRRFLGFFASHPPIDRRVSAISQMSGAPVPRDIAGKPVPREARFESPDAPHENWITRERRNRKPGGRNPWK